ncbi:MAG: 16S rRNA (cytosine(967)-C(5))-methyltransferase RsmB [Rhodothermales bacterium]
MAETLASVERREAVRQLLRVDQDRAYVGRLDAEELDARGQRQVREYVAGVTRWRRWFDFLLASFYRGDFARMDRKLVQILRIGLYDLFHQQTPDYAALNEAVNLARTEANEGAAKLVNAVLRTALRKQDDWPVPKGSAAKQLAIRQSHPTWLVTRWLERFGPEGTAALLNHNNARPHYGVRVRSGNRSSLVANAELDATPSDYLDDFVRMQQLQGVLDDLKAGTLAVQDEAAGLVVRVLDPQPGEVIVDSCAAPGGKALYAADRMQNTGRIIAVDRHEGKLKLLANVAGTTSIIETYVADARTFTANAKADAVLVDAPCSGTGVLAKRADLRWHLTPENLPRLTVLQDALLDQAATLVKPGGRLVYSTCSLEPEENTARVTAFLTRHSEFQREPLPDSIPESMRTAEGDYQALPHQHGTDGAFAVRLRRQP